MLLIVDYLYIFSKEVLLAIALVTVKLEQKILYPGVKDMLKENVVR